MSRNETDIHKDETKRMEEKEEVREMVRLYESSVPIGRFSDTKSDADVTKMQ